jgi:hypothetical protein
MMRIGKGYNMVVPVVIVIMLLAKAVCAEALRVPIRGEYLHMKNLQKIVNIFETLNKKTSAGGLSAVVLCLDAAGLATDCKRFKPNDFTNVVILDLTEEQPFHVFMKKIESIGEGVSEGIKYIPVTINGDLSADDYKTFADMCRNLSIVQFYGNIRFVIIVEEINDYDGILTSGSQFVWEFIPEENRFNFLTVKLSKEKKPEQLPDVVNEAFEQSILSSSI